MKYLYDLHMHTRHSDGAATVNEMGNAAWNIGMKTIGFSDHAYEIRPDGTKPFGMKGAELDDYIDDVEQLKEQYTGKMEVLCGLEAENISGLDHVTSSQLSRLDYLIGSTHSMVKNGEGFELDFGEEFLIGYVDRLYRGDYLQLAKEYYDLVSHVVENTHCRIIGHFDLIMKYNQGKKLYDDDDPVYREAALSCMEKLLKEDVLFEINTGAISRGNRKDPYPSRYLLTELNRRGGKITLNSDAHMTSSIGFAFESAVRLAWECGFRKIHSLSGGREIAVDISDL